MNNRTDFIGFYRDFLFCMNAASDKRRNARDEMGIINLFSSALLWFCSLLD